MKAEGLGATRGAARQLARLVALPQRLVGLYLSRAADGAADDASGSNRSDVVIVRRRARRLDGRELQDRRPDGVKPTLHVAVGDCRAERLERLEELALRAPTDASSRRADEVLGAKPVDAGARIAPQVLDDVAHRWQLDPLHTGVVLRGAQPLLSRLRVLVLELLSDSLSIKVSESDAR